MPATAVVGRVAQDHEDRRVLFHPLGAVALFLQFGKRQRLLHGRLPAGEGVGEEDAGAFLTVVGQRRVELLHGQPDLKVGDDERRGHDLEAEHPFERRLLDARAGQRAQSLAPKVEGNAAERFTQIRAGTAAGVENVDVIRGQPLGDAEIIL